MASIDLAENVRVSGATGGRVLSGEGALVMLVHGAAMDRTIWSLQTRWLAHHGCDALALDLPGHGASAEPERESIEEYAEWLAAIAKSAGRPVHVVGHSMGSFVAIETALRAPLASITLVGTAAAMPVHPALLDAAEANDPLAAQLMCGWAFAPGRRTGPHPSPGSSMVGSTLGMISQAGPGVLHHDLSMCAAYSTAVESAGKLSIPTTLLLGELDRMTPVAKARPLIDAIDGCRVEVVSGVGHMVQVEAPEATRSLIADTVATVDG